MKKIYFKMLYVFLTIFSIDVLYSAQAAQSGQGQPMFSVLSWNILGPYTQDVEQGGFFKKGDYSRIDKVIEEIKKLRWPYILCLQEIDKTSEHILESNLTQYTKVGYSPKGQNGGVILFVRKDRFDIRAFASIDLTGGGAAVVALLQSKVTGAHFIVSSLHLSRDNGPAGHQTGTMQLKTLLNSIKNLEMKMSIPNSYKIFAGDFNTLYGSCVGTQYGQKIVTGDTVDLLKAEDNKGRDYLSVFGNVGTTGDLKNRKTIDYILFSNGLQAQQYSKIVGNDGSLEIQQQVPSDHAILYAVFVDPGVGGSAPVSKGASVTQAKSTTSVAAASSASQLPSVASSTVSSGSKAQQQAQQQQQQNAPQELLADMESMFKQFEQYVFGSNPAQSTGAAAAASSASSGSASAIVHPRDSGHFHPRVVERALDLSNRVVNG